MLMHHTDAQANGVTRSADVSWLPIDEDLTAVGMNQAVEDVHQRGFACAVLANQGMDFTLVFREIGRVTLQSNAQSVAQPKYEAGYGSSQGSIFAENHGRQGDKTSTVRHAWIEDPRNTQCQVCPCQAREESTGNHTQVSNQPHIYTRGICCLRVFTYSPDTQANVGAEEQELSAKQNQQGNIKNDILLKKDRSQERNIREWPPGERREA